MKIAVFYPRENFTEEQRIRLSKLGEVTYIDPPIEHDLEELKKIAAGADILAIDPDNFGGFEKARDRVTELLETLPNLIGLALDTTSFGYIDVDYCRKRNLVVTDCPGWSRETVAELSLAMLLNLSKKIIFNDRKTQKGEFKLEMGYELKGKKLGIIGVGSIGSATAELARGIGMVTIGYNHFPKKVDGIEMKNSLDDLLKESDAISIHITHRDENKHFIGKDQISKMKSGVIIVNMADREQVDEEAMAEAMKSGKVFGYAFEGEDLTSTPLAKVDNAIGLKGFGWYTKEALERLFEVWVKKIESIAKGKPQNVVS